MVKETGLYDILEVKPNASKEEIMKSGKKLSVKWHPDKHPKDTETATKKFQEIQEALSILSNEEKREMYDNYGLDGLKGLSSGDDDGPFGPFGGGFPFPGNFPFGGFSFGGDMFGNMSANRAQERENIMKKLDVTLDQIYKEETVNLKYEQKVTCHSCNGEGTSDGNKIECSDCDGKGVKVRIIRMGPGIAQQQIGPCITCNSKGKVVPEGMKCSPCFGKGYIIKEKTVPITLKNGFGSGIKMQLEGKGNHINNYKTDLVVVINELEHPEFKRRNSDLIIDIKLKLYQALFGFDKIITHLDGRKLHIHHTGKTNYGAIRRIQGEGMFDLRTKQKGDMIIKFTFELPTIKNETLQKAIMLLDKPETLNEKETLSQNDLIKTIMTDVSDDDFNHRKEHKNSDERDDDNENNVRGVQCAQQ